MYSCVESPLPRPVLLEQKDLLVPDLGDVLHSCPEKTVQLGLHRSVGVVGGVGHADGGTLVYGMAQCDLYR